MNSSYVQILIGSVTFCIYRNADLPQYSAVRLNSWIRVKRFFSGLSTSFNLLLPVTPLVLLISPSSCKLNTKPTKVYYSPFILTTSILRNIKICIILILYCLNIKTNICINFPVPDTWRSRIRLRDRHQYVNIIIIFSSSSSCSSTPSKSSSSSSSSQRLSNQSNILYVRALNQVSQSDQTYNVHQRSFIKINLKNLLKI